MCVCVCVCMCVVKYVNSVIIYNGNKTDEMKCTVTIMLSRFITNGLSKL